MCIIQIVLEASWPFSKAKHLTNPTGFSIPNQLDVILKRRRKEKTADDAKQKNEIKNNVHSIHTGVLCVWREIRKKEKKSQMYFYSGISFACHTYLFY
jgi:hypothetical protein